MPDARAAASARSRHRRGAGGDRRRNRRRLAALPVGRDLQDHPAGDDRLCRTLGQRLPPDLDIAAVQAAIDAAIAGGWPLYLSAGTYKITRPVTIDYAGRSGSGFRLISAGATLDGRSVAAGPVLQVECSGGTPASPTGCFYFHAEGTLFVAADTPGYAVVIGK